MTHSHDTATPALSVESEYVLVPREPTLRMVEIGYNVVDWCKTYTMDGETDPARVWRAMWDAVAPAHNPSPAAKGGEAVREAARRRARELCAPLMELSEDELTLVCLSLPADQLAWLRSALATPSPQPAHSDDLAVDRFAVAMKAKLADARAKGKGGWYDETACSQQYLSDELRRHALKPDPLDVANFAMFLHQRNEEIALPSPQPADAVREALRKLDAVMAKMPLAGRSDANIYLHNDWRGWWNKLFVPAVDSFRAALASDPAPAEWQFRPFTDPALTITFQVDRDGNVADDTQTHGNSFGEVYRAFHVIKSELDRQIRARRTCPFNPVNKQPPEFIDPAPAGEAVEPVGWRYWDDVTNRWYLVSHRINAPSDAPCEPLYARLTSSQGGE